MKVGNQVSSLRNKNWILSAILRYMNTTTKIRDKYLWCQALNRVINFFNLILNDIRLEICLKKPPQNIKSFYSLCLVSMIYFCLFLYMNLSWQQFHISEIPLPNEQSRLEILKIHAQPIAKHGEIGKINCWEKNMETCRQFGSFVRLKLF